jgi:hypothetical protein
MFSLFWDQPLYNTYYAYDPFTFRRTPSRRSRYLNYLENQLASLINDEFDDFWDSPPSKQQPQQQKQVQHEQPQSQSQPPANPAGESQLGQQQQSTNLPDKKPRLTEYRFQSRATYNGRDYVEEHRERFTGEDGGVHVRTRRRLGDRWYELEDHTDADGKTSQRETWHNVGDDQIEAFKQEWTERHQPLNPPAPASTTAAIKQQPSSSDGEGNTTPQAKPE